MPAGRPRKLFNRKIAKLVCERLACSDLGVAEVVSELNEAEPGCVTLYQIWTWLHENAEFSKQYALAREWQADYLADLNLSEARKSRIGVYTKKSRKDGVSSVEQREDDNVARSRLIIETRWKRAGQLKPKVYRERSTDPGETGPNEQILALQKALMDGAVEDDPVDTGNGPILDATLPEDAESTEPADPDKKEDEP